MDYTLTRVLIHCTKGGGGLYTNECLIYCTKVGGGLYTNECSDTLYYGGGGGAYSGGPFAPLQSVFALSV